MKNKDLEQYLRTCFPAFRSMDFSQCVPVEMSHEPSGEYTDYDKITVTFILGKVPPIECVSPEVLKEKEIVTEGKIGRILDI